MKGTRVQVTIGKSAAQINMEIMRTWDEIKKSVLKSGKQIRRAIIQHIKSNTKTRVANMRNSEPIINNIKVEAKNVSMYVYEVGIGNMDILDINSPHWRVINWGKVGANREGQGGEFLHPARGNFVPGQFQSAGTFTYAPYSGVGIFPKNPIPAMNYISKGNSVAPGIVKKNLSSIRRT